MCLLFQTTSGSRRTRYTKADHLKMWQLTDGGPVPWRTFKLSGLTASSNVTLRMRVATV